MMFGNAQTALAMKLTAQEYAWMPKDEPDLMLILRKGQKVPSSRAVYLAEATFLLKRLVAEANESEIREANNLLADGLQAEEQMGLPLGLLDDPQTPGLLMNGPAVLGSPLHEWKESVREAMENPNLELAPPEEANAEAEELSLESFLSRFL